MTSDPLAEALAQAMLNAQQGCDTACCEPPPWMHQHAQRLADLIYLCAWDPAPTIIKGLRHAKQQR